MTGSLRQQAGCYSLFFCVTCSGERRQGMEMVGRMVLGTDAEFVRVRMEEEGGGRLERPNRFRFAMPLAGVRVDAEAAAFEGDGLVFRGQGAGRRWVGTVQGGVAAGTW